MMISVWVLVGFFVIFTATLIWERLDYRRLYSYAETLEHFLDMYISRYGTLPGISEAPKEDVNIDDSKQ